MFVLVPILTVAAATALGLAVDADPTVAGFVYMLAVAGSSLLGRRAGLVAALLAALAFNYFFVPPVHTLTIDKPSDLLAWATFSVVAILIGGLVGRAISLMGREAERRREEAGRSSAKAAFFAGLGHNLRTPLTTITTAVDSLLTTPDRISPDEQHALLESIRDEANRLTLLVSRSLELGRVTEGSFTPSPVPIEVLALVQSSIRRLGNVAAARCTFHADDDATTVYADPALTEEVLIALIENAVAYAPGPAAIEINATRAGPWVDTAVVDHGPGIDAEHRERVFDEYVRGPNATGAGTGLGLAVARALAEAQGGSVALTETAGGGATFTVRLPTEPATPPGDRRVGPPRLLADGGPR